MQQLALSESLEGIDEKVLFSVTFRDRLPRSSNSVAGRNKIKFAF